MHIERLEFTDQAIVLNGTNRGPVGRLTLSGTPTEDVPVTVSIAGVTDADNVGPGNPTGAITGPVAYFWQTDGGTGVFEDITTFGAGEAARAHGLTFTPGDDEVGSQLRVRAVYKDAKGVLEEVFSAPALVANINDAPTAGPTISDTTPTEGTRPDGGHRGPSSIRTARRQRLRPEPSPSSGSKRSPPASAGAELRHSRRHGSSCSTPTQAQVNREAARGRHLHRRWRQGRNGDLGADGRRRRPRSSAPMRRHDQRHRR